MMPAPHHRLPLARLVAAAADDLDADRVARARLTRPVADALDLDDVAAALGFDIDALRSDLRAGRVEATIATA